MQEQKETVFTGRKRIYTTYEEVNENNLIEILRESCAIHAFNVSQITYLWRYYKGIQPILNREKDVRPEICNKIVENHAQEIVAFKIGYQLFEPVQYVSRTGENEDDDISDKIKHLNTLMFAENKESRDRDLFEWLYIAGQAYRLVLPDKEEEIENGGAPYEIFTPDPRSCFIVRTANYSHKPLMGVYIGIDENDKQIFNIYTRDTFYLVKDNKIIKSEKHVCGNIPIIKYDLNNARMGVFESVLPILDSINAIESNRLDGIEQTVQCLMKFINCDVSEEDFSELLKLGAVKVRSVDGQQGDVDILKNDLDQTQTQVTKDDLYQTMYNIVGMPNITANKGSTNDTGVAVLLRDGWTLAESHAKSYELKFKESEQDFLRIVLNICAISSEDKIDLRIRDIEMAFNRRNYENSLTKTQVLTTMLDNDKIHPLLAFQACGLFTDPEAAYIASTTYAEKIKEENMQKAVDIASGNVQNLVGNNKDVNKNQEPKENENEPKKQNNIKQINTQQEENPAPKPM